MTVVDIHAPLRLNWSNISDPLTWSSPISLSCAVFSVSMLTKTVPWQTFYSPNVRVNIQSVNISAFSTQNRRQGKKITSRTFSLCADA